MLSLNLIMHEKSWKKLIARTPYCMLLSFFRTNCYFSNNGYHFFLVFCAKKLPIDLFDIYHVWHQLVTHFGIIICETENIKKASAKFWEDISSSFYADFCLRPNLVVSYHHLNYIQQQKKRENSLLFN